MSPLGKSTAWTQPLPEVHAPADMAIYHLPTGTYETRAAFAFRGGSFRDKRHFAASAILVRHPQGDLLIDAGFGADVAAHIAMLPRFMRSPHQVGRTVGEQLGRRRLRPRQTVGRAAVPLARGPRERPRRPAGHSGLDERARAAVRRHGPGRQGLRHVSPGQIGSAGQIRERCRHDRPGQGGRRVSLANGMNQGLP